MIVFLAVAVAGALAATTVAGPAQGRTAPACVTPVSSPTPAASPVRPFDPSAPGALSVGQMTAAWDREVARFFPDLGAGGG